MLKKNHNSLNNYLSALSYRIVNAGVCVITTLCLTCLASLLYACGNARDNNEDAQKDSASTVVDSAAIRDSLAWVGFRSNDLTFFGLHGHVKMMLKDGVTYEFSRNGEWILMDGVYPFNREIKEDDVNNTYSRSNNGMIVREENWEGYTVYSWRDGMLFSANYCEGGNGDISYAGRGEQGYQSLATYAYDTLGRVSSISLKEREDGAAQWSKPVKTTYHYLRQDASGNWIIRRGGNQKEIRTIAYYDSPRKMRDSSEFLPLKYAYSFVGKFGSDPYAALIIGDGSGACNISGQGFDITLKSFNPKTGQLSLTMRLEDGSQTLGEWNGMVKVQYPKMKGGRLNRTYIGTYTGKRGSSYSFQMKEK